VSTDLSRARSQHGEAPHEPTRVPAEDEPEIRAPLLSEGWTCSRHSSGEPTIASVRMSCVVSADRVDFLQARYHY